MNLDRFRDVADEKTLCLVMTPELSERILSSLPRKRRVRHRNVALAAAACLMVMALSAGVLAMGNIAGWFGPDEAALVQKKLPETVASNDASSQSGKQLGALLPSGDDVVVELSLGSSHGEIVPKQDEESGLWGYVNEDGAWIVEPIYYSAEPVEGIGGRVTLEDGKEIWVLFSKKMP